MPLSPTTVAERIEAAGWEVELFASPPRLRAIRRNEKLTVLWSDGIVKGSFIRARYFIDDIEQVHDVPLPSIGSVLLRVRRRPVGLPFSMTDDDETILAALAGRTITWTNSVSELPATAVVPRGGVHLKLEYCTAGRCLTFASADGTGFHTVRLAQITEVS